MTKLCYAQRKGIEVKNERSFVKERDSPAVHSSSTDSYLQAYTNMIARARPQWTEPLIKVNTTVCRSRTDSLGVQFEYGEALISLERVGR